MANEAALKVIEELMKLSDKELQALVDQAPEHWSTGFLKELGYFDQIAEEIKKRNSGFQPVGKPKE